MNDGTKHPIVAFLLSFFPGGGLFYYRYIFRGMFYFFATLLPIIAGFMLVMLTAYDEFLLTAVIGFFFYFVSFIDTIMIGVKRKEMYRNRSDFSSEHEKDNIKNEESERFFTIVLSFIPGVGHFQLGLMQRGLTFLTAFVGIGTMVFLVAVFVMQDIFLIFLAFLPIIWIYSFFDAVQQLNKKQRGEKLVDRSILEDLEKHREHGQKSKTIATLLSVFPGAGHLYLGFQQRGIQLMAAFLISLYVLDVLRLSIFFFLIPIIWFYSFFDGLQKANLYGVKELEDKPIIKNLKNHQKWLGIGLIVLGLFFILDRVFIPSVAPKLSSIFNVDIGYWYYEYFQITVISILLIGGGIKLFAQSKKKVE